MTKLSTLKHGIYYYDFNTKSWRLLRSEGDPFTIGELGDGLYMIYFDNTKCEACEMQDEEWIKFIQEFKGTSNLKAVVILCEWFASKCESQAAAETYRRYKVRASPTIIVALYANGKEVCRKLLLGVRFKRELEYHAQNPCRE